MCFIGGIEHPLTPELNLITEYYSGTHAFSGIVSGLVYHNHKQDLVLVAGFRLPSSERAGNPGFVIEIGKFFGPKRPKKHEIIDVVRQLSHSQDPHGLV